MAGILMSAAAEQARILGLRQQAKQATDHAARLASHIQAKLDEGADPAWYMVRELDRRHETMVTALAELAAAEAEMHSGMEENTSRPDC